MVSSKTTDETIWLTDGSKTYSFKRLSTDTMTAFGSKTEYKLTVFHDPMAEAIEAIQGRMHLPGASVRFNLAREIVQSIHSTFNQLVSNEFAKD